MCPRTPLVCSRLRVRTSPLAPQHHLKIRSAGPKNEDRFKLTKQVLNIALLLV